MQNKIIKSWFTLIEIIVSITIFSIIMISVMMIYASASWVSYKIDLSRSMQENTKNIVESISNDIRNYGISWVSLESWVDDCNFDYTDWLYRIWDKLCLGDGSIIWYEYYIAKQAIDGTTWNRIESSQMWVECWNLKDECVLVRLDKSSGIVTRISNSLINFRDISFLVSKEDIAKVVVNFTIQASARKWVNSSLIENSKLVFQTTISQRLIDNK